MWNVYACRGGDDHDGVTEASDTDGAPTTATLVCSRSTEVKDTVALPVNVGHRPPFRPAISAARRAARQVNNPAPEQSGDPAR